MKITLLNGSPKIKKSTSAYLLNEIESKIKNKCDVSTVNIKTNHVQEYVNEIRQSNAIIIAFPLYVDAIPSHVLRTLEELQSQFSTKIADIRVYVIVNSGFYEARQNSIALAMMKLWCKQSGLFWGAGLAVGAGEMAQKSPMGKATATSLGKALDKFISNCLDLSTSEDMYVEPNFPRALYKLAAHWSWNSKAKSNNISKRELYKYHPNKKL